MLSEKETEKFSFRGLQTQELHNIVTNVLVSFIWKMTNTDLNITGLPPAILQKFMLEEYRNQLMADGGQLFKCLLVNV